MEEIPSKKQKNPGIIEVANTIIRGEKAIAFPLRIDYGRVTDKNGHHILDIRGWGFLQYADDDKGAELQDAIGEWVVETLNANFEEVTRHPE